MKGPTGFVKIPKEASDEYDKRWEAIGNKLSTGLQMKRVMD